MARTLLDRLTDAGQPSSLQAWMRRYRVPFAARLSEMGRPNWKRIAAEFAADGLRDARGNPPSAHTARMMWQRVRREATLEANRAQPTPAKPAPQKRGWKASGGYRE